MARVVFAGSGWYVVRGDLVDRTTGKVIRPLNQYFAGPFATEAQANERLSFHFDFNIPNQKD